MVNLRGFFFVCGVDHYSWHLPFGVESEMAILGVCDQTRLSKALLAVPRKNDDVVLLRPHFFCMVLVRHFFAWLSF